MENQRKSDELLDYMRSIDDTLVHLYDGIELLIDKIELIESKIYLLQQQGK